MDTSTVSNLNVSIWLWCKPILISDWQNNLQTGLIVGGWDKYEGGQIYGVPLGGTILQQPFAIGGIWMLKYVFEYNVHRDFSIHVQL
jgi:20S proteasome alpha/beta subunit